MAISGSGVFTWMFIRLVNSDAYSVVHGLRYNITDSQVAIWILHGTISTVLYTAVLSRDHLNVSIHVSIMLSSFITLGWPINTWGTCSI